MKATAKLFLLFFLLIAVSCGRRFSEEDWKADKNRPKQVNSLIRSKRLIGKSYNEVINMLGKENILPVQKDTVTGKFTVEYLTGRKPSLSIDFERLRIYFENDKVVKAEKNYD